jgi:hypothetical protein
MTKERFAEFLNILIGNMEVAFGRQQAFVIYDNVSSHNDGEEQELPGIVEMRRLPPYSPFLTPACWPDVANNTVNVVMCCSALPTTK